ncbi:MAG: DegT/DnrJ/EryC1/StrS family aminotransferase [Thermoguttaceae bacterium]|nr:DegT/DnrJ/EryC1/StrS family aminotransferase [Thermoguttaceae bacterium]
MPGPGAYWIGEEERREVLEVVDSKYWFRYGNLQDPNFKHKVYDLEQELCKQFGCGHALATTSGTASLLVSLLALGIKPGDEVIVPAYTFVASYTSIIFAGGVPVLTEIDDSLTIDPNQIEKRITPKTRAIMPVHMLGNPCDMEAITDIAKRHGLPIIEDSCQAFGATYRGKNCGTIGDIGAFSLNFFKTITSGDGGLVSTNSQDLYERAFGFHDQGHLPNRTGVEVGNRLILGLNFRMNELTGAGALAQLRKLPKLLTRLRTLKKSLKEKIADLPGIAFRKINDPEGECGTLLTVIYESAEKANQVGERLGTGPIARSGWHVYSNMEHVGAHLKSVGQPSGFGAYPVTDDMLLRSMNISVGVVDGGLGAGFGVNINSTEEDVEAVAQKFRAAYLGK